MNNLNILFRKIKFFFLGIINNVHNLISRKKIVNEKKLERRNESTIIKNKKIGEKIPLKKRILNEKVYKTTVNIFFSVIGIGVSVYICMNIININESKKVSITTNKAEEYFYDGKYDEAINEYIKISKNDKLSPWWDMKIAEVYSVRGNLDDSKKYIEKVKEKKSKDGELLNYVVFTEFMNKDDKEALKDGEASLQIASKNKSLIKTMFTVYMSDNQKNKAKNMLEMYPLNKKSAYDTAEYARMLMLLGDKNEGYSELKTAWLINKDEYKIYDVLSQIAICNRDDLLQDITQLSQKNPNDIAYKMWLAKIYSLTEATAGQADSILNSIKNQDTGKVEVKLIEASILQNTNQVEKSNTLINSVINENKGSFSALHTAGWLYLNKKDYTEAEEYCKKSILANKDYPDNYGLLMPQILQAEGKADAGEPYFRTALLKEPYNYNIMLNIANFYYNTDKNTKMAMEYFKMAHIVKPDDPEILYNIAEIYLTNNDVTNAIDTLKDCIKLADSVGKYHRTLGTIYMTNGDVKNGIVEIRYAYHADESDVLTLNNAGCYYFTVEEDFQRGYYNFQKAYEGLKPTAEKDNKDIIIANYNKAKDFYQKYNSGSGETLQVPDFVLFY
ncbi:MAG: hypothetical protein Q8900_02720 [Bacillota bacterium]|nr:hypothetical protein [Bacillota bacterium]